MNNYQTYSDTIEELYIKEKTGLIRFASKLLRKSTSLGEDTVHDAFTYFISKPEIEVTKTLVYLKVYQLSIDELRRYKNRGVNHVSVESINSICQQLTSNPESYYDAISLLSKSTQRISSALGKSFWQTYLPLRAIQKNEDRLQEPV